MRETGILMLLLVAAFCLWGFIASFEPGPTAIYYRIGYLLAGFACIATAALLWAKRGKS